MGNDLHARVQTLARPRRRGIGVSDRWDSSGGAARDDYLICYRRSGGASYSRQFLFTLRTRRSRYRDRSVSLLRG